MHALDFLILTFATFRIIRLITKDTFPPVKAIRDRLLRRWPDEELAEQTGAKPTSIGELITCPWCAGFWISVGVYAAWLYGGIWVERGLMVFAVAGAASLLASIENAIGNFGVTEGAEVERLQEMKDPGES